MRPGLQKACIQNDQTIRQPTQNLCRRIAHHAVHGNRLESDIVVRRKLTARERLAWPLPAPARLRPQAIDTTAGLFFERPARGALQPVCGGRDLVRRLYGNPSDRMARFRLSLRTRQERDQLAGLGVKMPGLCAGTARRRVALDGIR